MSGAAVTRPAWDEARAAALLGAVVLVGITHMEGHGARLEQAFGTVTAASPSGVEVALGGVRAGEVLMLPPDLESFHEAAPGDYRLRGTSEVVVDPAFTAMWTVYAKGVVPPAV